MKTKTPFHSEDFTFRPTGMSLAMAAAGIPLPSLSLVREPKLSAVLKTGTTVIHPKAETQGAFGREKKVA